jgi:hypothetical protein
MGTSFGTGAPRTAVGLLGADAAAGPAALGFGAGAPLGERLQAPTIGATSESPAIKSQFTDRLIGNALA